MIPRLFHFSVPNILTQQQTAAIETVRRLHPTWEVHIWKDDAVIPNSRLLKYLGRAGSGAQRADLIRLDALSAYGGVYLDADVRTLRAFDEIADHYDFFIASEDGYNLTNALFGATPGHPALEAIITFLEENEPDWSAPPNETTGPVLFGKLLRWRPDVDVLPRQTFYPYNWNDETRQVHRLSYSEHLWASSWKEPPKSTGKRRPFRPRIKATAKRVLKPVLSAGLSGLRRAKQLADEPAPGFLRTYPTNSYSCSDEVVVLTIHGQKIILDGHDLSITPDVALRGCHEGPEEAFVRRTLRGGDWFVDVGANVGTFSILAASICGPFGRVLAFEPNPHVRRLLSKSAVLNWYHDRLQIFELALGDADGIHALTYYPSRLGDAQINAGEKHAEPFHATGRALSEKIEVDVPVRPLDALIPVDVPIRIMKIDAEFHEDKVLAGSARLLAKRAFDFIIMEADIELATRKWGDILKSLRALTDNGYKPASLDQDGRLIEHGSLNEALARRRGKTFVFSAP